MPELKGINITEVWDYRLSKATPLIDRRGGTWVVQIWPKNSPDYTPGTPAAEPLETYDTGIRAEKGDEHDTNKLLTCYDWLLTVRDKYSRDDIDTLKPALAKLRAAEREFHALQAGLAVGEQVPEHRRVKTQVEKASETFRSLKTEG